MTTPSAEQHRSFGRSVSRWWHRISRNWAGIRELQDLDRNELQRIAKDVCCDVSELQTLAGRWPESSDLLPRRLDALHIDAQALASEQPRVTNDLAKHCSLCAAKRQCEHDLDRRQDDPVWQRYCPNTMTLLAISKARGGPSPTPQAHSGVGS